MPIRNAICLSIDSLQAGMLGPYGNAWIRTPEFDRLAAQSYLFDQAYACEPTLDAALAVWWSQGFPSGFSTTLVTDDPFVAKHPSAAAFSVSHFVDLPIEVRRPAKDIESTQLAAFFARAIDQLTEIESGGHLWLHTRGMNGPWDAPLELRNQYADEEDPKPPSFTAPPNALLHADYDPDELLGITHAYAGQVSLLDACLGVFLAALDESPIAKDTLLLLIGARGFPLGEHLRVGECDAPLYNELTHIPFFVRYPDGSEALNRSQAFVTHQDVPRTLVDWLARTYTLPTRDHLILRSKQDRAIRTPAWYLRESDTSEGLKRELYAKPGDRWEVNDVADRCADVTAQLSEILASPPIDPLAPLPDALVTSFD